MVKPPFFIEWEEREEVHNQKLEPLFQKQFKIHKIIIDSENALKHYLNGKMVRCDYP